MNIDILTSGTDGTYPSIKFCYDTMKTDFANIAHYIDGTTSGSEIYSRELDNVMVKFYKNFAGTIITHLQNYGMIKVPVLYVDNGGSKLDAFKIDNDSNGANGYGFLSHSLTQPYTVSGTNTITGTMS